MYTTRNYKTKKQLKEAVERGDKVTYYQPNDMGFASLPMNGSITLEGPHFPQPHKWYAQATVENGCVVKVK